MSAPEYNQLITLPTNRAPNARGLLLWDGPQGQRGVPERSGREPGACLGPTFRPGFRPAVPERKRPEGTGTPAPPTPPRTLDNFSGPCWTRFARLAWPSPRAAPQGGPAAPGPGPRPRAPPHVPALSRAIRFPGPAPTSFPPAPARPGKLLSGSQPKPGPALSRPRAPRPWRVTNRPWNPAGRRGGAGGGGEERGLLGGPCRNKPRRARRRFLRGFASSYGRRDKELLPFSGSPTSPPKFHVHPQRGKRLARCQTVGSKFPGGDGPGAPGARVASGSPRLPLWAPRGPGAPCPGGQAGSSPPAASQPALRADHSEALLRSGPQFCTFKVSLRENCTYSQYVFI